MKKILFIITGLEAGGAENSLFKICLYLKEDYEIKVVSLTKDGPIGKKLNSIGIHTHILNIKRGLSFFSGVRNLFNIINTFKPDIINTWMYHSDLIGSILAISTGRKNIFWTIRNNIIKSNDVKKNTQITAKICATLSNVLPRKIIYNSISNQAYHEEFGYCSRKSLLINNGFTIAENIDKKKIKHEFCRKYQLDENKIIVSFIARFDRVKNHIPFLCEYSKGSTNKSRVILVLAGTDVSLENNILKERIMSLKLEENTLLLGEVENLSEIYAASDLVILPSSSEAFPNVIAEAMSYGTPCLSNNVGDAANIIMDTGFVNQSNQINDFVRMLDLIVETKTNILSELGVLAKKRIKDNYSINKMINNFREVFN